MVLLIVLRSESKITLKKYYKKKIDDLLNDIDTGRYQIN